MPLTPHPPPPTFPLELTPQSTVFAPHLVPAPRVGTDTASVLRVSAPLQTSPPKFAPYATTKLVYPSQPRQKLYKVHPCALQSRLLRSRYIHLSCQHTCSTVLEQFLIQEYDYHITHLYHTDT